MIVGAFLLFYLRSTVDIKQYRGDGAIKKVGEVLLDNGFVIEFDSFILKQGATTEVNIERLPKFHKKGMLVFLLETTDSTATMYDSINVSMIAQKDNSSKYFEIREKNLAKFSKCVNCYGFQGLSYYYFDKSVSAMIDPKLLRNDSLKISLTINTLPVDLQGRKIKGKIVYLAGGFI